MDYSLPGFGPFYLDSSFAFSAACEDNRKAPHFLDANKAKFVMGVVHLWEILHDAKTDLKLDDLKGKLFAVDLATWICASESVKINGKIVRMYLRNLFFRVRILLKANINLVFVLDGKAPGLKLGTISKRLASSSESPKKHSSGIRRRLDTKLNECCNLLDALGVPWIKAEGEAESLCAELNRVGLVDGVMTSDGDAFLYGASTVIRNLSSEKNCVIEMYTMKAIKEKLGLERNDLIALALLLGCDYCPKGVAHIGVAHAVKLLSSFEGVDSLEVFNLWRQSNACHNESYPLKKPAHCTTCGHEGNKKDHMLNECASCKDRCARIASKGKCESPTILCSCIWHQNEQKQKVYAHEDKVKVAALQDPSFPNKEIIQEFLKRSKYIDVTKNRSSEPLTDFELLKEKFHPKCPVLTNAVRYLTSMLEWKISYAFKMVLPLVASFVLAHEMRQDFPIQLDCIVKKSTKYFDVKWKLRREDLISELPDSVDITTRELQIVMEATFPNEVHAFHERLQKEVKAKAELKKAARRTKATAKKSGLLLPGGQITDHFKAKKRREYHPGTTSKTSQDPEESSVESGSIQQLDVKLQSLSLLNKTVDCYAKTTADLTEVVFQKKYQQKGLTSDDSRIKQPQPNGTDLVTSKPKKVGPKVLFSSDSESESDGEDRLRYNLAKKQPTETERYYKQTVEIGVDITDTSKTPNDSCDITFSQDINFSLGSGFLSCLDGSLPLSPAKLTEKRPSDQGRVLRESNYENFISKRDDGLEQSSSTPNKSHEPNVCETDSPVFMTLLERLNARKNVKS